MNGWQKTLAPAAAVLAIAFAITGCGNDGCVAGGTRVQRLVQQLQGGCCQYHTQPTDQQIDRTCKEQIGIAARTLHGGPQCSAWAAECLGQLGPAGKEAVPALIAALTTGPNNFDTGDGVIHTRNQIAVALGRIGDPRALGPLLDVLANPRVADGSWDKKPLGEAAALEGLGYLGEAARPEVPRIVSYLLGSKDREVVRAAALALGRLRDPRAIAPLILALDDQARLEAAAIGLRDYGAGAASALPTIQRLLTAHPDDENNYLLRSTLAAVGGRAALKSVPGNYEDEMTSIGMFINELVRNGRLSVGPLHNNPPGERLELRMPDGDPLVIRVERKAWVDRRQVSGSIGRGSSPKRFTSRQELETLIAATVSPFSQK